VTADATKDTVIKIGNGFSTARAALIARRRGVLSSSRIDGAVKTSCLYSWNDDRRVDQFRPPTVLLRTNHVDLEAHLRLQTVSP